MKKKNAFTLVELLAVIIILGVIVTITAPTVTKLIQNSKEEIYQNQIVNIERAMKLWGNQNIDLLPDNEGGAVTITIADLKKASLIELDMKNPKTKKCFPNDMTLTITNYQNSYIYRVNEDTGTPTDDCEIASNVPTITLIGNEIEYVEIFETYIDPGFTAKSPAGDDITNEVITTITGSGNTIDTSDFNEYTITYQVTFNEKTTTVTRKVIITDTIPPILTIPGDTTIESTSKAFDVMAGVSATDNSNKPVTITNTHNISFDVPGTYTITYVATDTKGNKTTKTRKIIINQKDEIGPVINSFISNNITSNSITLVVDASDTSGIGGYYYSKDNGATYTAIQGNNTYTFTGLTKNTAYNFKVKVVDNIGNITESTTLTKTTLNITAPTYNADTTTPTKNSVNVTITYPSNKENTWVYEYKKDNGSWTEVTTNTTTVTFTQNGTLLARVRDTANASNTVEGALYQVTNIDKTGPVINNFTTNNITSSAVTLVVSATDDTSISGYYFSKDNGATYTTIQNTNTYTFSGLTKNTNYSFKVKVEDTLGNITVSNTVSVTTTSISTPTYSASTTSWTKNDVTVTINYPTNKESNWEYQYIKDGTTNVVSGTSTTVTFTSNGSVVAKIVDKGNANNTVTASTYNVGNIDKETPTITIDPTTVTIYAGDNYNLMTGVTTSDTGGSEVASTTIKEGSTTISSTSGLSVGTHTLTYTVTDAAGNSISKIRTLTVKSSTPHKDGILNGADPEIGTGMIPVTIDDDGTTKKAHLADNWYDYSSKKWANVVTVTGSTRAEYMSAPAGTVIKEEDILTYLVWIPRYRYQLWNVAGDSTGTRTSKFTIDVVFENKNTTKSTGTTNNSWLTHPSFTFGADELNGYWVGKFETGYNGATTSGAAQVNGKMPEKVIVKPTVYAWKGIDIANAFFTVQDMKNNGNIFGLSTASDTHLMKNTEWGAIMYLADSKYGSSQIWSNRSGGITGIFNNNYKWNTPYGVATTTTSNIYGVYDMSGGLAEYVMGYAIDASPTYGTSSGFNASNFPASKYYDAYINVAENREKSGILGDATKETGPFTVDTVNYPYNTYSSWESTAVKFITTTNPWFTRNSSPSVPISGGGAYGGELSFWNATGAPGNYGFRIVILGK